ncbi:hypothetical protein HMPREF3091_10805 [Hafnia sp. HMSC23F03]|nr:hypothetical protein HMPREF3091_10805 [Hafnia sp. HMSC23F03]
MNLKVYIKNFTYGLFGVAILLVVWFFIYPIDDSRENFLYSLFLGVSLFLYPFSRCFIQNLACKVINKKTWGFIIGNDISTPKLEALFSFICLMLAIPLGGIYALYFLLKMWSKKTHL